MWLARHRQNTSGRSWRAKRQVIDLNEGLRSDGNITSRLTQEGWECLTGGMPAKVGPVGERFIGLQVLHPYTGNFFYFLHLLTPLLSFFHATPKKNFLKTNTIFVINKLYMIQFVYPAVDSLDGIPGAKFEKTINNKIKSICFILFL